MPEGTIKSINRTNEWANKHGGSFIDYYVTLASDGWEGEVYLTKKAESPAPTEGETLDFEKVKQDQHGIKIKKVYDTPYTPQNGSSGPSAGGSGNDPRQDSIERQVAAKVAGEIVAHHPNHPQFVDKAEEVLAWIRGSKELDNVHAAQQAFGATAEVPPETDGLPPASQPASVGGADSDIPFAASRI